MKLLSDEKQKQRAFVSYKIMVEKVIGTMKKVLITSFYLYKIFNDSGTVLYWFYIGQNIRKIEMCIEFF